MSWKTLGSSKPKDLFDARLQLHHASQIVAAAGVTFLAPEPDDSHPNFGWAESSAALLGRTLPGANASVGLRVADLCLLLVDAHGEVSEEFALDGKTLDDGYAWLAEATVRAGVEFPITGIARATYDIPSHPVESGAVFSGESRAAFDELARWFANGHEALTALAAGLPGSSEVRCWPHHFDLGSLAVVAENADGSLAKSIGFGLSPGDDSQAEPYWYVSPWPYPETSALPALEGGGRWHTEGYVSAILTGSDLVAEPPDHQRDRLLAFLDDAVAVSRRVIAD